MLSALISNMDGAEFFFLNKKTACFEYVRGVNHEKTNAKSVFYCG